MVDLRYFLFPYFSLRLDKILNNKNGMILRMNLLICTAKFTIYFQYYLQMSISQGFDFTGNFAWIKDGDSRNEMLFKNLSAI